MPAAVPAAATAKIVPETVVMKFGGTSVADAERIKRAARRIVAQRDAGRRVVAVLSARGKTTDELIAMAEEVSATPDRREMDMLLSTGERISCALCAMAINDLGHRAISLTGSQAGIVTDTSHTKARILDGRADRIQEALREDRIVLVAGFQGVSTSRDVTTLGRGGSDTTAVALAAAIGAEVCEIYTDVAGVFSADPRIVTDARKLPQVSFEEMLEMAASGARVLQLRAVEYARNHEVRIHCRSSFDSAPGTVVLSERETLERPLITAVTHSTDEARITLLGVPDRPGAAAALFPFSESSALPCRHIPAAHRSRRGICCRRCRPPCSHRRLRRGVDGRSGQPAPECDAVPCCADLCASACCSWSRRTGGRKASCFSRCAIRACCSRASACCCSTITCCCCIATHRSSTEGVLSSILVPFLNKRTDHGRRGLTSPLSFPYIPGDRSPVWCSFFNPPHLNPVGDPVPHTAGTSYSGCAHTGILLSIRRGE